MRVAYQSVRELFLIPKYSKEKLSLEGFFDINILPHPEQNRIWKSESKCDISTSGIDSDDCTFYDSGM